MSTTRTSLLLFLTIIFTSSLSSQDISVEVFVHDHHTYAPLDSALVKISSDGVILDSSYTGKDGRTQLTITPTGVGERQIGIPNTFSVSENYPNPFRDETMVDFSIPESQTVRADVYNIIGQRVLSEELPLSAGYYSMKFSLSNLSTGIYFLRLHGMEQPAIKLMKLGGAVHYDTRLLSRGNIQVTARSGVSLPLQKITGEDGEFTIQVEKDQYKSWSVTKQIESDAAINAPLVLLDEYLLTDIDGNVYHTVKIGDQWWMAENLRTSRYRNSDEIPTGLDNTTWENDTTGAYAIYPDSLIDGLDGDEQVVAAYGKLYNWYVATDERGLCPEGWHVPSDDDWKQLEMYLGITRQQADDTGWRGTDEGGKMKSTRTKLESHPGWRSPNTDATNESGFSGLPGGFRHSGGNFDLIGMLGSWWSSTETMPDFGWSRYLYYETSNVGRFSSFERFGRSVRCIKDEIYE